MKRFPLIPTLIVGLAVAVMIGLGVWQLQRKAEKEAALERYAAAQGLPAIAWPSAFDPEDPPLFRRSSLMCPRVLSWRAQSGRNVRGDSGWVHVADCGNAIVLIGWSERPDAPAWNGGPVAGVIGPDRERGLRLIADRPPAGLAPARAPSTEDVPNNHLFYALQWFFFAAAAAVIYVLALNRRAR